MAGSQKRNSVVNDHIIADRYTLVQVQGSTTDIGIAADRQAFPSSIEDTLGHEHQATDRSTRRDYASLQHNGTEKRRAAYQSFSPVLAPHVTKQAASFPVVPEVGKAHNGPELMLG